MAANSSILCVANYPSDVGYAWWLMESYWVKISELFTSDYKTIISYPEINAVPIAIKNSNIQLEEYSFKASDLSQLDKNLRFIRKHNVKVIYLSDYGPVDVAYALYRLAGVEKIIVHDHTPGQRTEPQGVKRFLKRIWANLPFIRVDAAFGATDYVKERLEKVACVSPSRCFAIQNGIVYSNDAPKQEKHPLSVSLPTDKKIIVTASRANKYKGINFALDVIADLINRKKLSNFIYLFCGDGPDLENFKRYARELGIEKYCHFAGRVENIQTLFKSCHIAFQPSNGEVGYSLSILEYMANQLPVIVPDNPSVCGATLHNKTGQIYKDKNTKSAADALAIYLEDEQLRLSHGKSANREVMDKYTLLSTHAALENAMLNVVRR